MKFDKIVGFLSQLFKTSGFYTSLAFVGIGGMIASSFLFVKGVKEIKNAIKAKCWKGVGRGALKCLPMVISVAMSVVGVLVSRHIMTRELSNATETISRLSSLAAPVASVAQEQVEDIVDRVVDESKPESKPEPKNDRLEMIDVLSGQTFYSTVNTVEKAVNDFNSKLLDGDFYTVNDWYYYLGLPETVMGENLGWQVNANGDGMLKILFAPKMVDGRPITHIVYRVEPRAENTRRY